MKECLLYQRVIQYAFVLAFQRQTVVLVTQTTYKMVIQEVNVSLEAANTTHGLSPCLGILLDPCVLGLYLRLSICSYIS